MKFESTNIWKNSLGKTEKTEHAVKALERLRVSFMNMRDNVEVLVNQIHEDCKGLTVHDITHLDALWETADTIIGDQFTLNPAEAFVLGGSILLHDAGMSVAAFPRGLTELKKHSAWKDNVSAIIRRETSIEDVTLDPHDLPPNFEREAIFYTLRELHAKIAEKLATQSWPGPNGDIFLLEDPELRSSYGNIIGRIAHSHHWDIEKVKNELDKVFTPDVELPKEWIINPQKIACILRCADATHIDKRRAPTFRYALTKPKDVSDEHWNFQNKLNQVTEHDGKLVYKSGQPFTLKDVGAWWQAYDTLKMIDKELRISNNLLEEIGEESFQAQSVLAIESSKSLAKHIKTDGWIPINAEISVSDPVHLAKILGGKNLYKERFLPVVRELLQNSADAIRARRSLEGRGKNWGKIQITFEKGKSSKEKGVWLHVDDNGIGMSQSILTTTLIDFGKSIWTSSKLREEYPGLVSKMEKPIGQFGIGFFSVFMLADKVRVISRRYDDNLSNNSIMEFSDLSSRPILMPGNKNSLPTDVSTRISLLITNEEQIKSVEKRSKKTLPSYTEGSIINRLQSMIASLDVSVVLRSKISDEEKGFLHEGDWLNATADSFLAELYPNQKLDSNSYCHLPELLQPILDDDGTIIGKAGLTLYKDRQRYIDEYYISIDQSIKSKISVGGFCVSSGLNRTFGVFSGSNVNVSRNEAKIIATDKNLMAWYHEQSRLISQLNIDDITKLEAQKLLFNRGLRRDSMLMSFFDQTLRSYSEFKEKVKKLDYVLIPSFTPTYESNPKSHGIVNLGYDYHRHKMTSNAIVLSLSNTKFFDRETDDKIKNITLDIDLPDDIGITNKFMKACVEPILEIWGSSCSIQLTKGTCFEAEFSNSFLTSDFIKIIKQKN